MTSKFLARRIIVTNDVTGEDAYLVLEFSIDCDLCGQTEGIFYGHHLRTLHKVLEQAIAAHPELCGTVGETQDTTRFEAWAPPKGGERNN